MSFEMSEIQKDGTTTAPQHHSSLVARLNARMLGRLVSIFLCLDVLLCLLALGGLVLWAEDKGAGIAHLVEQQGLPQTGEESWTLAGGYTVHPLRREIRGVDWSLLPFPNNTRHGLRTLTGLSSSLLAPLWEKDEGEARYVIELDSPHGSYAIWLNISGPLRLTSMAMQIVVLCQLLSLVSSLFYNAGTIRRVLRPIQDLASVASLLGGDAHMDPEELELLAHRLGRIDPDHLDERIPVEDTQRELQELARSINAMLERIDRSYRAQMRFVSDASHELRTPIAVIQGYARLLGRWGKDDPAALQESIDAIIQEAAAMGELVEQLLFLARGDNNSLVVERETFDLTEVADQVLRDTRLLHHTHPISAHWPEPIYVHCDPGLIKQAVRVLMDNAIKYTPEGGAIHLSVEQTDGQARLSVTDEGVGIEADDVPRIFDRFFRADRSRTRSTGGSGLGLSIAKWIVERHDGWMEVTSRPGAGTRMTMVLPIAPSAELL